MNTTTNPECGPESVNMLESAQEDLEQFRKELGHDQVNVLLRYHQLKTEIKEALGQMKAMIQDNKVLAREVTESIQQKLLQLQQQVETPDQLSGGDMVSQLSNIRRLMEDIVKYLGKITVYDLSLARINDRMYRYKIKLSIIKLKVQLGTMQLKDTVLDTRHDFKKRVSDLRDFVEQSEEGLERRWKVFHHEISTAYEHMQKAFTSK
jgi:hypothetical protein